MEGIREASETFEWCKDKTKLVIWDKQVFCIDEYGDKYWCLNGKYHRENGPAIECVSGYNSWWLNDQLHRENGPAVEYACGWMWWYVNGRLHREDGPAVEHANGTKLWYLKGKEYSESEYWEELQK